MICIEGSKASVEEFLNFWMHRGGFEYVGGELEPMPEYFGDHGFPCGSIFEDSDFVVVKLFDGVATAEIESAARRHMDAGNSVVVFLASPSTVIAVYRSESFAERFAPGT